MFKPAVPVCALVLLHAALPALADQVISTFDTGPEDWLVVGLPGGYGTPSHGGVAPIWSQTGQPGGSVYATDLYAETFFAAPASFLGNQSAAWGHALSFDIYVTYTDNAVYPAVVLQGATRSIYYNLLSSPVGAWTTRNVPLAAGGWRRDHWHGPFASEAEIIEVLSDLDALYINAEWRTGPDKTYLDNVILTRDQTAVCGDTLHPWPAGDVDRNCYTDLPDLALITQHWLAADCAADNDWCAAADLDFDNRVDLRDFAQLTLGWLSCTDPGPPCAYLP